MTWIAVAVVASAAIGGGASVAASNKQSSAAKGATGMQAQQFSQTGSNLQPFLTGGQAAQGYLEQGLGFGTGGHWSRPGPTPESDFWIPGQGSDPFNSPLLKSFGMSDFQQSPSYQFNLQEGQKAIDKASNARGMYYAPQTLQDTSKFSQGLASNEFNNAYNMYNQNQSNQFNRLFATAGAGQNAAVQQGGFGANFANNAASNTIGAGNAQAAGIMGVGNAAQNAIGQGYNAYLLNQILSRNQSGSYGADMGGAIY